MRDLQQWLDWIATLHGMDMDLSLERVQEVAGRLNVLEPGCPVITVGGTNGKGSCVAGLEAIYLKAGFKVGVFSSPILFKHNEYVRLNGVLAEDEAFCSAFEKINVARGDITLTPFEFNALAAFLIFQKANLDVWILEVGLGGRFDAVNALDADAMIVASVDIDHAEWLGDTREKIGFEKAGIFRSGKPAVCGDFDPPQSLVNEAEAIGAPLFCQGQQFGFKKMGDEWQWWSDALTLDHLPIPHLALQNMACVLMVVELMQKRLPVTRQQIKDGLQKINLPGRIQVIPGDVIRIFDVAHNPAAAAFLANYLREHKVLGKTVAVFSMLGDKDIVGTVEEIKEQIQGWYVAPLSVKRAASREQLMRGLLGVDEVKEFSDIKMAYQQALAEAKTGDRVVVFGSFSVVGAVMKNSPSSTCGGRG